MNFFYKINLFLNLIRYSIKEKFSEDKGKHFLFLKDYFKEKKDGFYIDVGCFHPIRLSNTKFLYDKGWRGINIDISSFSIDLFNYARPDDINLNIAARSTIGLIGTTGSGKTTTIDIIYGKDKTRPPNPCLSLQRGILSHA